MLTEGFQNSPPVRWYRGASWRCHATHARQPLVGRTTSTTHQARGLHAPCAAAAARNRHSTVQTARKRPGSGSTATASEATAKKPHIPHICTYGCEARLAQRKIAEHARSKLPSGLSRPDASSHQRPSLARSGATNLRPSTPYSTPSIGHKETTGDEAVQRHSAEEDATSHQPDRRAAPSRAVRVDAARVMLLQAGQ